MKFKQKKSSKTSLSEKIADALTLKPRADIEDDQVFGTKPQTVSRADFSSESEDEAAISDFRKRSVNLLSDLSKKYEGQVISRKDLKKSSDESTVESESENEQNGHYNESSGDSEDETLTKQSNESDTLKKLRSLIANDDTEDSEGSPTPNQKKTVEAKGIKTTSDSDDFGSDDDGESDDYSITQFKKQLENDDSEESNDSNDDDNDDNDDDEDEGDGYDISQMEEPVKEEFEHVKKQNVSEEAKKGACVRNQLLVWEGLLEMRIHLQRCMNTANQMPMPETYEELKNNNDFIEECNVTKENVANMLDKFLTLQNALLKNFPETKNFASKHSSKKPKAKEQTQPESDEEIASDTDNEEIPSDTEPEDEITDEKETSKKNTKTITKKRKLEEYEKELATSHKVFKSFRDSTILKWNGKTRLATATNVKNAPTNTILQQISYILSDREKLVRRTQLKRSEYDIIGYRKSIEEANGEQNGTEVTRDRKDNDEYIPEIFDDSDFYHQLLRELIECKSADISDPVQLSRQWIALQQMRSKMKRKVDTKATKGRKIKYVVHNKLVNFMAPEKCTTWTDESTNELYSSLFGKMFEQNNVGLSDNLGSVFKIK